MKPVGLNNSYFLSNIGGSARRIKKPETKTFERDFDMQMSIYNSSVRKFNMLYNENEHYLSVDIRFFNSFITKKKTINKRGGDWDGLIKITQDCVFSQLFADDSAIMSGNVTKVHSEDTRIEFNINIHNLKDIL